MDDTHNSMLAASRYAGRWPVVPMTYFRQRSDASVTLHPMMRPIRPCEFDAYKFGKALFQFHLAGEEWARGRKSGDMWPLLDGSSINLPFAEALLNEMNANSSIGNDVTDAFRKCCEQMQTGVSIAKGVRGQRGVTLIHGDCNPGNILQDVSGDYWFTDLGESGFGDRRSDFAPLAYLVRMRGLDESHFEAARRGYGRFAPTLEEMDEYVFDSVVYRLGLALRDGPDSPVYDAAVVLTKDMAATSRLPSPEEWAEIAAFVEPEYWWNGPELAAPLTDIELSRLKSSPAVPRSLRLHPTSDLAELCPEY